MKIDLKKETAKLVGEQLAVRGKGSLLSELREIREVASNGRTLGYGLLFKATEKAQTDGKNEVPSFKAEEKDNDSKGFGEVPLNVLGGGENEWNLDVRSPIAVAPSFGLKVFDGYTDDLFRSIPLIIGFDTEWVISGDSRNSNFTDSIVENSLLHIKADADSDDLIKDKVHVFGDWNESSRKAKRRVLSYQLSCAIFDEPNHEFCHFDYIFLCEAGAILTYARLITEFLSLLRGELPQFKNRLKRYKTFENPKNYGTSSKEYKRASKKHEESYPYNSIVLVGHFNGVDLTNFANYKKLVSPLVCLNKLCFFSGKATASDNYYDKLRGIRTKTSIRDTMLLSSTDSSLKSLGGYLGIDTFDNECYIDSMDALLRDDIKTFIRCSLVDSVISLFWAYTFVENNLNFQELAPTVGNATAKLVREDIKAQNGWATTKEFEEQFLSVRSTGNYFQKNKNQQLSEKRSLIENEAISSFLGGRNESFTHGLFTAKTGTAFLDIDLRSAYPIAMAICNDMNWENPIQRTYDRENTDNGTLHSEMFAYNELGFGYIHFKFPEDVAHPCIPIKSPDFNGLVFPREGTCFANISEMKLAMEMGAFITINDGGRVVVLQTGEKNSLFEAVKKLIKKRKAFAKQFGKKSGQALLYKLFANSLYGKMAQGIKGKRYINPTTNNSEEASYSIITQPHYAAAITAMVRCLVSFSIHVCESAQLRVHSVTTDGFIVLGEPESTLRLLNDAVRKNFPFIFDALGGAFSDSESAFEVKHEFQTLFNSRTRANVSLEEAGVMAKGSYRGDNNFRRLPDAARHQFFFDLLLKRTGKVRDERVSIPSFKESEKHNKAFLNELKVANLNYDYDFKRMVDMETVERNTVTVNGKTYAYDSFLTRPLNKVEEYDSLHKYRDSYTKCINCSEEYANIHQKYLHDLSGTMTRYNPKMNIENEQHLDYICKELLKMIRKGMLTEQLASLSSRELYDLFMASCDWDISYEAFNNAFKKGKGRKVMLDRETPLFSGIKDRLLGAS